MIAEKLPCGVLVLDQDGIIRLYRDGIGYARWQTLPGVDHWDAPVVEPYSGIHAQTVVAHSPRPYGPLALAFLCRDQSESCDCP